MTCSMVISPALGFVDAESSRMINWKGDAGAALTNTFHDNGIGDNRDVQASILKEYGVHGTFHVITSNMNEGLLSDLFHRGRGLGGHSVKHSYPNGAGIETIGFEVTGFKEAYRI